MRYLQKIEALTEFDRCSLVGPSGYTGHYNYSGAKFGNVYVETNPNFKSWMTDPIMEGFTHEPMNCQLDVLIVRRQPASIISSLHEQGWWWKSNFMNGYSWSVTSMSERTAAQMLSRKQD